MRRVWWTMAAVVLAAQLANVPSASAVTITEFSAGISDGAGPTDITAGPDGNLWFTENRGRRIGRITPAGVVTEFSAGLSPDAIPTQITAGPDGNLWFTDAADRIGRITPAGVITEFSAGITPGATPGGITAGADGNLYFVETNRKRIARVTTAGVITELPVTTTSWLTSIVAGPDGNLWFPEYSGLIGRLTPAGVLTEFAAGSGLYEIGAGPDGNLWFTETFGDRVGRITPTGVVTQFSAGITAGAGALSIVAGSDGNLWFTESSVDRVGRITPAGMVTEFSTGIVRTARPYGVTAGADGNLWFTEYNADRIGRIIPDVPPVALTTGTGTLTSATAVLGGTVRARGAATTYRFDHGKTAGYGQSTTVTDAGSGDATTPVSATLSGLEPQTTYHYRLVATSANGTSAGADKTFTTPAPGPTATATPTATETATPTPEATASPTPAPAVQARSAAPVAGPPKPSKQVTIPFSSGYRTPGVARAKACRGESVTVSLQRSGRELSRRRARLSATCRYRTTFTVARSRIGNRTRLTVVVRFRGNRWLGATSNRFTVRVPPA